MRQSRGGFVRRRAGACPDGASVTWGRGPNLPGTEARRLALRQFRRGDVGRARTRLHTRAILRAAWGESKLHASYLQRLALRREILGEGERMFFLNFSGLCR